jgi:hypothetical protein
MARRVAAVNGLVAVGGAGAVAVIGTVTSPKIRASPVRLTTTTSTCSTAAVGIGSGVDCPGRRSPNGSRSSSTTVPDASATPPAPSPRDSTAAAENTRW